MDDVARWPARERAELFTEAGSRRGLAPAIIEKDFWVCWTLKRLFKLPDDHPSLVFKGGTSLSKVYNVIRRFSEDIDLSFDRKAFGYDGDKDPAAVPGKRARERLIDDLDSTVERHIDNVFVPALEQAIKAELGDHGESRWNLTKDPTEAKNVFFHYPPGLTSGSLTYISPIIRLELGARGDVWPVENHTMQPYAADEVPDVLKDPACGITVLAAKRTFWEKATILHAQYHRQADIPMGDRLSRHYYDLALLGATLHATAALAEPALLEQVANHKSVFFPQPWARYESARIGSLRLSPPKERLKELSADYVKMAPMIFDQPPPKFDDVIASIAELESRINRT